ncbi:hypothetical protein HZS_8064 [Henneguya salminicola]|nr:hypothetical protein HZS_8064 [Henneguya salminicola]
MTSFILTEENKQQYDLVFKRLGPTQGKLDGEAIKNYVSRLSMPKDMLQKIWTLSDLNNDGFIDKSEFYIFMKLVNCGLKGIDIPQTLPPELLNISKSSSYHSAKKNTELLELDQFIKFPSDFIPDSDQKLLIAEFEKKLNLKKSLHELLNEQKLINKQLEEQLDALEYKAEMEKTNYRIDRKKEIELVAKLEKAKSEVIATK